MAVVELSSKRITCEISGARLEREGRREWTTPSVGAWLHDGTLVLDGCRKSARVMRGPIHRARRTSDARMTLDIVDTVRVEHYI